MKTYGDALDFLFARTTGIWKLGLERVEAFLHALGDPQQRIATIHVAGTNGKGSVCATLESVLRAKGLRVAKYTSPHLVDFRERFVIDGNPVDPERIVAFVDKWTPEVERLGATFFEATTAMAFEFFAEAEVDIAVIETGLGGRLDATNVIRPLVAVVTGIAIDHVEYLGETREAIAYEKAGIFKRGVPAVIGEPDHAISLLLRQYAEQHGALPIDVVHQGGGPSNVLVTPYGTEFTRGGASWRTPLLGAHQAANATVALAALDLLPPALRPNASEMNKGLAEVHLAGRFQRWGRFIFDVAHNPDGARTLARTLAAVEPPRPVVALLSVLADKDWRGIMSELGPVVDRFVLTHAPTAPASRTWSIPEPLAFAREHGWAAEVSRDFGRALELAAGGGGTVLVTGSFHTVGDAMQRLEVNPAGN